MKPRKPLPRSTKFLKRTPITRKPTKRKKAIDAALNAAKDHYFSMSTHGEGWAECQKCGEPIHRTGCNAHHKIKRSIWATAPLLEKIALGHLQHSMINLIILCHDCHKWAHDESHPENLKRIRYSLANAENGAKV